jgi:hypothetical protein
MVSFRCNSAAMASAQTNPIRFAPRMAVKSESSKKRSFVSRQPERHSGTISSRGSAGYDFDRDGT